MSYIVPVTIFVHILFFVYYSILFMFVGFSACCGFEEAFLPNKNSISILR